jgi:hypothetical protein
LVGINNIGIGEVAGDDVMMVLERYSTKLLSIPGVTGCGMGDCQGVLCIHVYVLSSHPEAKQTIPQELEGFKVEIYETEGVTASSGTR